MRLTLAAITLAATLSGPIMARAADISVGQTLACTSSDPGRRLTVVVGRIEPWPGGLTAVSVSLYVQAPDGSKIGEADHLPIELRVLAASCPGPAPRSMTLGLNFEAGYAQWKSAHGGVFTLSVEQIEATIRKMIEQPQRPQVTS